MIYLIYPHAEHEHLKKLMKKLMRPIITIGLGFILALFSAALTFSSPPAMEGTFGGAAAFFIMQPTSTPQTKDLSEIGSTDGIVFMGILITLIVIVPILLQRKSWMENR
jgi:FtsH-binding integral membrane protein